MEVLFAPKECGEATLANIGVVQRVLDLFCKLSGQVVSLSKSRILFSANTETGVRQDIVSALNVAETMDISPYLGFPIMAGRVKKSKVNFIIQKLQSKLSSWKSNCLSKAGKLTLIQSTLNAIPNYYMQVLSLPNSCTKKLNSVMAHFLWGKGGDQKGVHMVRWDQVAKPTDMGGLGVKCCVTLNKAHFLKLWWRFFEQNDNLAIRFLRDKYGNGEGYLKSFNSGSHIWKGLGKTWETFKSSICWGIGNGEKISIWQDKWIGGESLQSKLIGPVHQKDWDLKLTEAMTGGLLKDDVVSFPIPDHLAETCKGMQFFDSLPDFPYCDLVQEGRFSFGKAMAFLSNHQCSAQNPHWVWKLDVPPKLKFFLWEVVLDRLPDCKNLAQRNIVQSPYCVCCVDTIEDAEHICRACPAASEVWELIDPGLPSDFYTMPFQEWLVWNCKTHPQCSFSLPWHSLFPHILWALWLRRNDLTISQTQLSASACLDKAKALAWNYTLYHDSPSSLPALTPQACWLPPPPNSWALNVDGSFISKHEPAAVAGVFRNAQGEWMLGFQRKCVVTTPLMSELQAIYDGLNVIHANQWHNVVIRSDCANAVALIAQSDPPRSENYNLALACRLLLQGMQDVRIELIPRQANKVADMMARLCRKTSNSVFSTSFVMSPMMEIVLLYEEDKPP